MSINLKVTKDKINEKITYPCLMIDIDGKDIVLFIKEGTGVRLSDGYTSSCWIVDSFVKFNDTVLLSNED